MSNGEVPVEEFGGFAVGMAAAYMAARLSE